MGLKQLRNNSTQKTSIKASKLQHYIYDEKGNVFFALFAAVALVGLLGASVMSTMRGPLTTVVEVNRRVTAEAQMRNAGSMIIAESVAAGTYANTTGDDDGDCDGDGKIEPIEYKAGAGPTGGGLIPDTIGSDKQDPWGTDYGYCVWDPGAAGDGAAGQECDNDTGADRRLTGTGSDGNYIIALVSAGANKSFDTTCANASVLTTGGDDIVVEYSYTTAAAASGGLWTLDPGDFGVAEIDKNLDVTGSASFSGDIDLSGTATAALRLGAASMILPTDLTTGTEDGDCTIANDRILRVNTGTTPDTLEICDGANTTWVSTAAGGGLWTKKVDDEIFYDTDFVGIGNNDPTEALDVTGNIQTSGDVMLSNTNSVIWTSGAEIVENSGGIDITGATDITGALTVSGISTLNNDVIMTGSTSDNTAYVLTARSLAPATLFSVRNDGLVTINGAQDFNGDQDLSGNLTIGGDINMQDNETINWATDGSITSDGSGVTIDTAGADIDVGAIVDITGNTDITGDLTVSGTTDLNGQTNLDGNVTATDGQIEIVDNVDVTGTIVSDDRVTADQFRITGDAFDFGPPAVCGANQYSSWTAAGWICVTDTAGTSGGTAANIEDVLGEGDNANGEDLRGANQIGADQFCNEDLTACFTPDAIATGDSGLFERNGTVIRAKSGYADDDFVIGSSQLNDTGTGDEDSRLYFDKDKSAFRAGSVDGTQWDASTANVGSYSAAFGQNTTASGAYSTASNFATTASGDYSTAWGVVTNASGTYSTAWGNGTAASGDYSTAFGQNTTASGDYSTAWGIATASGNYSTAWGDNTNASGSHSTAFGLFTTASGDYSTAWGDNTNASGTYSTGWGLHSHAGSYAETSFGRYSLDTAGTPLSWVATDTLFEIGNGANAGARANALTLLKNGTMILNGGALLPSTGGEQDLELDVEGEIGADMYCDEDGNNCFDPINVSASNSGIWEIDTNVIRVRSSNADYANDDFVVGSPTLDNAAGTDDDSRMYFDKSKAAFRAGAVTGTTWDASTISVGTGSVAFGSNGATASGTDSFAHHRSIASGINSFAMGYDNTASGNYSFVIGSGDDDRGVNAASGLGSFAGGTDSIAGPGEYTFAFGYQATASANYATSFGEDNESTGEHSMTWGEDNFATGIKSTAFGQTSRAEGPYSTAFGRNVEASGDSAIAFGREVIAGSGTAGDNTGESSVALGLQSAIQVADPKITGDRSFVLFMDGGVIDANTGFDFTGDDLFGIIGGRALIDPTSTEVNVSTGNQQLELDVEGDIGAINYCDEDGNNCFTASEVTAANSAGSDTEIIFNESGVLDGATGFTFNSATSDVSMGNDLAITGDLTISGDDLIMGTNTDTFMLIANGTNYSPVAMSGDTTITNAGVTTIGADKILESMLNSANPATDEYCLTYESGGDFEWEDCLADAPSSLWTDGAGDIIYYNSGTPRVGIGLTDPDVALEILDDSIKTSQTATSAYARLSSQDLAFARELDGAEVGGIEVIDNGAGSLSLTYNVRNDHRFESNSVEILTMLSTGNIGIGDITTDAHLEVSANGTTGGSVVMVSSDDANDGDLFIVHEDGDVGIGATTNSASLLLDVEGQIGGAEYCDENGINCFEASDVAGGTTSAPGADQQVIFNDSGVFGGDAAFTFNSGTGDVTLGGDLTVSGDDIIMGTNTDTFMLIANGTNYSPVAMSGDITITNAGATTIGADKILESMLNSANLATDEYCLTYESGGDFEWEDCLADAASSLWTDDTTHITYESAYFINIGETLPAIMDDNGTRMFWYHDKAAFRGGAISAANDAWQDGNIGTGSFAFGSNAQAQGTNSVAFGSGNTASGNYSFAHGSSSTASGSESFAMGSSTTASGISSFAFGGGSSASANYTMAYGTQATASAAGAVSFNLDGAVAGGGGTVSGTDSFGIFLGGAGGTLAANDTMAIMGGPVGIGDASPDTGDQALELDIEGDIGAINYCDENGDNCFTAATATGVWEIDTNLMRPKSGTADYTNDDFVFGSYQLDDTATGNEDSRMYFDKDKSAFRAGSAAGTQWDASGVNVGSYSTAFGLSTTASGDYSLAIGETLTASGNYSHALGLNSIASDTLAQAYGFGGTASGKGSVIYALDGDLIAYGPTISGKNSFGIFMASAGTITADNVMSIMGGAVGIGTVAPSTAGTQILELDVEGDIGAINYCDEDGNNCFTTAAIAGASGIWEIDTNVIRIRSSNADYSADDFVVGSYQLDDTTDTDHDIRMYFDKSKGAFRAGHVVGSSWATASSGLYSTAFGDNTRANGSVSMAWGGANEADANYSTAWGRGNNSDSYAETSLGLYSLATVGTPNSWVATDTLFEIGNGTGTGARSNALTLLKNGTMILNGGTALPSTGDQALELDVEGDIGAVNYCDEGGNNCFTASAVASGSTAAPGTDQQVIFNNSGVFGGDAAFTFNSGTNQVTIAGDLSVTTDLTVGNDILMGNNDEINWIAGDARIYYDNGGPQLNINTGANDILITAATTTISKDLVVNEDISYVGTLTDTSDRRLKTNIKPLGTTLDKIAAIDTYSFVMKGDKNHRTEFGVMAQELEEIFPTLVHTASDDMGTKSVNYVGLIAPMIEASKELKAENDELRAELNDLSDQVALLNKAAGSNVSKAGINIETLLTAIALMMAFGLGLGFTIRRKS